jgi:hypothetical protein
MTDMERHLMEGATIAEEAAAAAVAVPVSLHSLGSFSLKGVPEPVAVAQLVPLVLEGRLCQLLPPHLVNKVRRMLHEVLVLLLLLLLYAFLHAIVPPDLQNAGLRSMHVSCMLACSSKPHGPAHHPQAIWPA